jgi:hypothetical protein
VGSAEWVEAVSRGIAPYKQPEGGIAYGIRLGRSTLQQIPECSNAYDTEEPERFSRGSACKGKSLPDFPSRKTGRLAV